MLESAPSSRTLRRRLPSVVQQLSLLVPLGLLLLAAATPAPPAEPWEGTPFTADPAAVARAAAKVEGAEDEAGDFNELAWMLLEQGRVDDRTLDYAQRAVCLSSYGNPSHLHTLASIYADLGKTDEAPQSHDWYVFGRLAELYGLPDVARKYYKRVPPSGSPEEEAMSTHAPAPRRLAALGEEKKPQKANL